MTLKSLPEIRAVQVRVAELQSGQPHGPGAGAAGAAGVGTLRMRGSAGKRGGPGPARRAQCSCPEARRRLRALSPGCIVTRSQRGGSEAAGCAARGQPPGSATRGPWGQWRALSRRCPAATRARRETRPLRRVHAGRAEAPGPTLLRAPRPSLSPPGPRPVSAVRTSLPAPDTAPQPRTEHDLLPSGSTVIARPCAPQTVSNPNVSLRHTGRDSHVNSG